MDIQRDADKLLSDIKDIIQERKKLIELYSSLCTELQYNNENNNKINIGLNKIEVSMKHINDYLRRSMDSFLNMKMIVEKTKHLEELRKILNSTEQ